MSDQTLPQRVNLQQIRNRAKDLVKAFRDRDVRALALTTTHLPRLTKATDDSLTAAMTLEEAQHVIACQYGFASWRDLLRANEKAGATPPDLPELRAAINADDAQRVAQITAMSPKLLAEGFRFPSLDGERSLRGSALEYASIWSRPAVVNCLVELSAPVLDADDSGMTKEERLGVCIEIDDGDAVRELIGAKPALLQSDVPFPSMKLMQNMAVGDAPIFRNLPFTFATGRRSLRAMDALIELGARFDENDFQPVRFAFGRGRRPERLRAVVERVIAAGWDPRLEGPDDLWMYACEGLSHESVKVLLEFGFDSDMIDAHGQKPIDIVLGTYTLNADHGPCIDALVCHGAHHDDSAAWDVLRGRADLLERRLHQDPTALTATFDVRPGKSFGGHSYGAPIQDTTLLHLAANYGHVEVAKLLLRLGADVNSRANPERTGCNHTPIYHAANSNFNHCLPVLKVLLEAGAKPALLSTIHIGGQMHGTGVRGADRSFIGVTVFDYATEFPKEPHSIIPEPGSDSHLPHKSVVQLLRKVLS